MEPELREAFEKCANTPKEHLKFMSPLGRRIVRASRILLEEEGVRA